MFVLLGFNSIYSLPEGESVVSGSATFDRSTASSLSITTFSDKLIVNYNSFSIASQETVNFIQPSSSSIALNRVVGVDPSSIMGTLTANGRIFLVNPNGVIFGPNSYVDVAALVASTLNITDEDFLNSSYNFFKDGESSYILNQGNLIIRNGGYVCLLASAIENQGAIQANLGSVVLAAGEKMTLALDDLGQISVVIDEPVKQAIFGPDGQRLDSAIKNSGVISANGGKVLLTAKVLNDVFDYAINNSGIIEAKSLVNHNGVIELVTEGAPIINTGRIKAGTVEVRVKDSDFINTGEIITDGYEGLPNGGRISIEAATILHQGKISANAYEEGTAGEIIIISQTSTTVDTDSTTEARALGLVGNGGRILIDSLSGNTVVNTLAVIDVSAGAISGNAGFIEVSAFDQLGFYGILNGRAPPGYQGADVLLKTNQPFSPSLIETYSLFCAGSITSRNISIFSNQRVSIAGILTAQDTIRVESQGADFSGTINCEVGIYNMNDGDPNLSGSYTGNQFFKDNGNITVVGDLTVAGSLRIQADNNNSGGGDFTQNINTTITTTGTGNTNITIRSGEDETHGTGNVILGTINSARNLEVTAYGGYIRRNSDTIGLSADNLTLKANSGIGTNTEPLKTTISNLTASVTGTGDINLTETDAITITNIDTNNGSITISAGGNLTATSVTANGTSRDISLTTVTSGNILVGTLTADGDTITLTSAGAITDNNGNTNNITCGNLILSASSGIGSGDALETTIDILSVTNNTSNNIEITESDTLNIHKVDQNATGGTVVIQTTEGNLTVSAGYDGIAATTGEITLVTLGAAGNDDLIINDTVVTTSGKINLDSTNDVIFGTDGDVTNTSGEIEIAATGAITMVEGTVLNAGSGVIYLDADEDITIDTIQTSGNVYINSVNGAIVGVDADDDTADITAANLTVEACTSFGAAGNTFDLNVTTSNITGSGNVYFDVVGTGGHSTTINLSSGNIEIDGRNTTNNAGYEAITLTNVITNDGSVNVHNYGNDITATSVTASGTGKNISLTTTNSGDILVGTVTSTTGGVNLISNSGSIYASGSGPQLKAGATSLLSANGVIGTASKVFDVLITGGDLRITVLGASKGLSANLSGFVPSKTAVIYNCLPSGVVSFNNFPIWPPALIPQFGNSSVYRVTPLSSEQLIMYQVNTFDVLGPVYLYHPLTPADISAFEGEEEGEEENK